MTIPSCTNVFFLDNESLLVIQDSSSGSVYVCSIESQKKAFQERVYMMKPQVDEIKTIKLDETPAGEDEWFGLRNQKKLKRSDSTEFDFEDSQDSTGVKVIRFDEDIR